MGLNQGPSFANIKLMRYDYAIDPQATGGLIKPRLFKFVGNIDNVVFLAFKFDLIHRL